MHRIHITGVNPRTGTTLLAECMRLCFEIERWEEHEAPLSRLRACKGVYLTKTPRDLRYLQPRLWLDPRFYAICMVRDPRDTVVSKHGRQPDAYWSATSIARFREGMGLVKRFAAHPHFLWLKYEDLIERPDEVQQQIKVRFPFLVQTALFSEFHQRGEISAESALALNGLRSIDPSNRHKWHSHKERLQQQLELAGPIDRELLELGYETAPDWMARHGIKLTDRAGSDAPVREHYSSREHWKCRFSALKAAAFARLGVEVG